MNTVHSSLILLSVLASSLCLTPARAHDWYPRECCHDTDCAPVESILRRVPTGGGAPAINCRVEARKGHRPTRFSHAGIQRQPHACLHEAIRCAWRDGGELPLHTTGNVEPRCASKW